MTQVHVLLVEDEFIPAIYLQKKLVEFGFRVSGPLASGEEAVELALKDRPDIILMDLHLIGALDGFEAALAIQAVYPIPIVFMTGYPDRMVLEHSAQLKRALYLSKPAHPNQIRTMIAAALVGQPPDN